MNNDLINELNNKIDAKDKIINEQVLEIARLKDDIKNLRFAIKIQHQMIDELIGKIDKARDYIKDLYDVRFTDKDKRKLLAILGDKENETN